MGFLKFVGWLVLGLIGLVVVFVLEEEKSNQFEVKRVDNFFSGDGQGLEIVNVGKAPVTIKNVRVNEREDCAANPTFAPGSKSGDFPMTLNIGDKVTVVGSCRAIRTTIATDKQSATYSFK